MIPLPPALSERLAGAPRLVVAPVGLGFAQEALVAWAEAAGRVLVREAGALPEGPCLLLPRRRRELSRLPEGWRPEEALFLAEVDLLYPFAAWRAALEPLPTPLAEARFAACQGWPEGLRLARQIGESDLPLERHPLVIAHLERLVADAPREVLVRLAAVPLLLEGFCDALGVRAEEAEALADVGYLYPDGPGLRLPALLRRYLRVPLASELALRLAGALEAKRRFGEALELLAEAELWEAYLARLAEGFDSQRGAEVLRRHLLALPRAAEAQPAYRYLVGVLTRLEGELDGALGHFRAARAAAGGELGARIDNARGVTLALQGELEGALAAFAAASAAAASPRLRGEARHNRGGALLQRRRYAEAEDDLKAAVALFRESREYVREARSAQLLALSQHQRGLLQEARQGYGEALELLELLGQPTALARANLAEVLLLTGETTAAWAQLERAEAEAAEQHDARTLGYVQVNRALWQLIRGQGEAAAQLLERVLDQDALDAHLEAEARLLLARKLRLEGRSEAALPQAEAAAPLGLRAALEQALCRGVGLEPVIEQARAEEARFELASALLHRAQPEDLAEALALIRRHGYRSLLEHPLHAPRLAALAHEDAALRQLFPLRVRAFGALAVRFLGRAFDLAAFPTRKSAALLVRLALASHPLPRERLAEAFWPDTANPLHSLQTALYHLNRSLGATLVESRRGSLALIYPVQLDLAEFAAAAEDALGAPQLERAEAIRRALALAPGELLHELPEWFVEERAGAEALKARLLRQLAELEAPRPQRAAEALEALLELEPYDLEARERLIGLYRGLGEAELAQRATEALEHAERELL